MSGRIKQPVVGQDWIIPMVEALLAADRRRTRRPELRKVIDGPAYGQPAPEAGRGQLVAQGLAAHSYFHARSIQNNHQYYGGWFYK